MKPLILILLATVCAQAQTVADAARRERTRQAQVRTTKVFNNDDLKRLGKGGTVEVVPAVPVETPAPAAGGAPGALASATPAPGVDPLQQWQQDTAKLRTQVRDLMDQETAIQLAINSASAELNAPKTTQSAKDQAARVLETSQQKLVVIRSDLTRLRSELQEKDLAGPPAKK